MKKISSISLLAVLTAIVFAFAGCIKDSFTRTYTYTLFEPVYKTTAEVRANIKSNSPTLLQNPGKIYIQGKYIFLNEIDKGIHIIDNSNPAQPQNVAFIDIPGNVDLAVKENTLYADLYTDLVAIDISNPLSVRVIKIVENVFPHRYYNHFRPDTTKIITAWIKKDTMITYKGQLGGWMEKNSRGVFMLTADANGARASSSAAPISIGGSMARFTIVSERLYTVGQSDLNVFNISDNNPVHINKKNIGWNIETIYPFKNKLFIGSTNGMFIYDISNASNPSLQGQFSHVRSCDPVIADDENAYVILRSGTQCQGFTNQLEVLNITNLNSPQLIKTYPMTNPHGLSKDGTTLFICDGKDGVKIYNASNVKNLQLIKTIVGMESYDVIAFNNIAMIVAKDGLYQYNYSNLNAIQLLSKITLAK
ncbi:MAG: hypothetical protein M3352_10860 [Bacteroidota bacterium]|nr:hypothetical protein [Bacteroidota bacterium]